MLSRSSFKTAGIICCLMLVQYTVCAQDPFLQKLVPHHVKLQHGGGIGFFAFGFGYANRNKKLEADLLYGYAPAAISGIDIHSATLKLQWLPLKTQQIGKFFLRPLVTGILVNHSFGEQYFGFRPENYPYNYYKFPTAFNSALLLGSQFGTRFSKAKTFKAVAVYYELLMFDRELVSFANNPRSIRLDDILTIGFGAKVYLK